MRVQGVLLLAIGVALFAVAAFMFFGDSPASQDEYKATISSEATPFTLENVLTITSEKRVSADASPSVSTVYTLKLDDGTQKAVEVAEDSFGDEEFSKVGFSGTLQPLLEKAIVVESNTPTVENNPKPISPEATLPAGSVGIVCKSGSKAYMPGERTNSIIVDGGVSSVVDAEYVCQGDGSWKIEGSFPAP